MSHALELQTKSCKNCGKQFSRKRYSGRLEDATIYQKREFCSLTCANSREKVTPGAYLWRARKHRKEACEVCGYKKRLVVHHCDQDQTNNDPANLQTLCSHCHDYWHATAKRLGRPIAGRMEPHALLMGWPIGHTALRPSGTAKSRNVEQQHGDCLPREFDLA